RDTMAWWQGGTSNTLIAGEKHIPSAQLGVCDNTVASADGSTNWNAAGPGRLDCSYLATGWWLTPYNLVQSFGLHVNPTSGAPSVYKPIARNSDIGNNWLADTNSGGLYNGYSLGSYHPGTVNILLGDGCVRGIPVTIETRIPFQMTYVASGTPVTLP
ncbi:MAG: DUF1559 domain-containing protein, partial [Thermoguttaceae bacterium]